LSFRGRNRRLLLPQQVAHVRRHELAALASLGNHIADLFDAIHSALNVGAEVMVVPPDVEHLRRP
jgi:hypothetical protein